MNNDKGEEMNTTQRENEKWNNPNLVKDAQGVWVPVIDKTRNHLDATVLALSRAAQVAESYLQKLRAEKEACDERVVQAVAVVEMEQAKRREINLAAANAAVMYDEINKAQAVAGEMLLGRRIANK